MTDTPDWADKKAAQFLEYWFDKDPDDIRKALAERFRKTDGNKILGRIAGLREAAEIISVNDHIIGGDILSRTIRAAADKLEAKS